MADDDTNWARAQALLERVPPEAAHRQAARRRYDRRAVRFVVAVVCAALGVAVLTLVVDPPPDEADDPPIWRLLTGIALLVLGVAVFFVRLARPYGSRNRLAEPLAALSGSQRKELLRTVRGRTPVTQERLALTRLQAENVLEQRMALATQAALAVVYLAGVTVVRSPFTAIMAVGFTAAAAVSGSITLRDARQARRFLEEHPEE